jgi:acyl-CoA synthetase (AMP-forming)/AMP-acid ligase II
VNEASGNIAEALLAVAARKPGSLAIVEAKSGRRFTFAEIRDQSRRYARFLAASGLVPGQRVMLMVRPGADFICLTFALFMIGATVILIDPGMGYKNLLRSLAKVEPQVLIGIGLAHYFSRLFPKTFATVQKRFALGLACGLGGKNLAAAARLPAEFSCYQPKDDDLAAIIFTTGSTGPPKGVAYPHRIFATQLAMIRDYYHIGENDTDQPAFPLFALFSVALGAAAVIPDMDPARPALIDPRRFVNTLTNYGATYSFASPALWRVVAKYCQEHGIVLSGLKKILVAGAPVYGDLLTALRRVLPAEAEIHTPYGATECLPVISLEAQEILAETWVMSQAGQGICVGRPLPGIKARLIAISDQPIADMAGTRPVAVGEIGEIIVSGPVVTRYYIGDKAETAAAKIADSDTFWHRIGDVGYQDDGGRLWYCGRKGHRVRLSADTTLYTVCCEAVINAHHDVARSALVGVAAAGWQKPVMIIEPLKNFRGDRQRLLAEVAELAARAPVTRMIKTFLIHNNFPVDIRHNAKIFREKLAAWAARELAFEHLEQAFELGLAPEQKTS